MIWKFKLIVDNCTGTRTMRPTIFTGLGVLRDSIVRMIWAYEKIYNIYNNIEYRRCIKKRRTITVSDASTDHSGFLRQEKH